MEPPGPRGRRGDAAAKRERRQARGGEPAELGSAQLVERFDLEVERLVGGAAAAVGGDGDAVGLAADAGDFDRAGIRGGVGVDLEAPQRAGRLAAEGDHPAVVLSLLLLCAAGVGDGGIPLLCGAPWWGGGWESLGGGASNPSLGG